MTAPASERAGGATPDYVYDPDDWEATYCWADRDQLIDNIEVHNRTGEIVRLSTLVRGPDKWVTNVVISFDEDGSPDETEVRWFDTEEDARAALCRANGGEGEGR